MNRKGTHAIVVVLFIIGLMITGVVLIWIYLIPELENMGGIGDNAVRLGIELKGYTFYDKDTGYAFVQISRGADDSFLVGMSVVFEIDGKDVRFRTREVPARNTKKIFVFDLRREGIEDAPRTVKVSSIVLNDGFERRGLIASEVKFPILRARLSEEEWIQTELDLPNNYLDEGIEGKVIFSCMSNFKKGETYTLVNDLEISGTCFIIEEDDVVLNLHRRIIEGDYTGEAIVVRGDRVVIKNGIFRDLKNAIVVRGDRVIVRSGISGDFKDGIRIGGKVDSQSNITINNNYFQSVDFGIHLIESDNNYIYNNVFVNPIGGTGIHFADSYSNFLRYNDACGVLYGAICDEGNYHDLNYSSNEFDGNSFSSSYGCYLVPGIDYTPC